MHHKVRSLELSFQKELTKDMLEMDLEKIRECMYNKNNKIKEKF